MRSDLSAGVKVSMAEALRAEGRYRALFAHLGDVACFGNIREEHIDKPLPFYRRCFVFHFHTPGVRGTPCTGRDPATDAQFDGREPLAFLALWHANSDSGGVLMQEVREQLE
jgi:hypothetical protein